MLTDGGVARNQAEVIAGVIGQAVEQGDHVISDQFKAGLAELRAEIAWPASPRGSRQRSQACVPR